LPHDEGRGSSQLESPGNPPGGRDFSPRHTD